MRMEYDPKSHRRRSIRLQGYDYSMAGAYFVTICAYRRECFFGEIVDGEMWLSDAGRTARPIWEQLPDHYPYIRLDAFVIMPNHVHGIVILNDATDMVGAGLKPAPTTSQTSLKPAPTGGRKRHSLPEIIRAFKTFSSRRINESREMIGVPVWQRNYYEHVIRNDRALNAIRNYIEANPLQWANDPENPQSNR
jgi:REP element-mobilizing transposase RayT